MLNNLPMSFQNCPHVNDSGWCNICVKLLMDKYYSTIDAISILYDENSGVIDRYSNGTIKQYSFQPNSEIDITFKRLINNKEFQVKYENFP